MSIDAFSQIEIPPPVAGIEGESKAADYLKAATLISSLRSKPSLTVEDATQFIPCLALIGDEVIKVTLDDKTVSALGQISQQCFQVLSIQPSPNCQKIALLVEVLGKPKFHTLASIKEEGEKTLAVAYASVFNDYLKLGGGAVLGDTQPEEADYVYLSDRIDGVFKQLSLKEKATQLTRVMNQIRGLSWAPCGLAPEKVLVNLPPVLSQFSQLMGLFANRNGLTAVRDAIGEARDLREVSFNHNEIEYISPAIGKLVKLTNLELEGNRITMLPVEIEKLQNLMRLNLANNRLNNLPVEAFEKMQKLLFVNLQNNPDIPQDQLDKVRAILQKRNGQFLSGEIKKAT